MDTSLAQVFKNLAARGVQKSPLAVAENAPISASPRPPVSASGGARPDPEKRRDGDAEKGGALKQPHPDPAGRANYEALELHEKKIRNHQLSWIPGGEALREVRDTKLYRLRSIDTFEEYCERLCVSRSQAYSLITGYEVAANVRGVSHRLTLRAAVQLAKLKSPEDQVNCLRECIAGSGSRSPTADYIAAAVAGRLGKRRDNNPKRRRSSRNALRYRGKGGVATVVLKTGCDLRQLLLEWLATLEKVQPAGGCAASGVQ